MVANTPYREMIIRETKTDKPREGARIIRTMAGVAAIGFGVSGAGDYASADRQWDGSKQKIEAIREIAGEIAADRENLRKIGAVFQRDAQITIEFGRLLGIDRRCTQLDSKVSQRLIGDLIIMDEIEQIRREMRRAELTLREAANQIEDNELPPIRRNIGTSMIYLGISGFLGCCLYATRKREDQLEQE